MKGFYRLSISGQQGGRIDSVLTALIADLTLSSAQKVILLGGVFVNGRRTMDLSVSVEDGDKIEVSFDGLSLDPWLMSLSDIVYDDGDILVINKPAGVDTQPTPSRYCGTIYDNVQCYVRDKYRRIKPSIGMVQRLDRDTSGLIVLSIHNRAHKALSAAFLDRDIDKKYYAITSGFPEKSEGIIHNYIGRMRTRNRMIVVDRGGKEAITKYQVSCTHNDFSLIELTLCTGRMHQIRIHLSDLGYPIVGDALYDGAGMIDTISVNRQMLHAYSLSFKHPVSGKLLHFTATFPDDMCKLMQVLKLNTNTLTSGNNT